MTILTVQDLKKVVERVPDGFTVEYDMKGSIVPIDDRVEIDISGKRLIFK